jgi:hypothetical protein
VEYGGDILNLNPNDFRRASGAFILLEAVASLSILSLIVAGITTGAIAILEIGNYVADVGSAYDRADHVFSMLKYPADLCGYGMPESVTLYREVFSNVGSTVPFNWDGVISIADTRMHGGGYRKNGTCRIVYGIPTGAYVLEGGVISEDTFQLTAYGSYTFLDLLKPAKEPKSVKNWILLGASMPIRRPMWVLDKMEGMTSLRKMTLMWNKAASADTEIIIRRNDNLCYMGAIECEVNTVKEETAMEDTVFYIYDLRGGGRQPREDGVIDIRFSLDADRKMLYVMLLVRGDRRYEEIKTKEIPDWPQEYAADIPEAARHYRLFAFAESFELKNL